MANNTDHPEVETMNMNVVAMNLLLVLITVVSRGAVAQNTRVSWYSIDAGFAIPSSPTTAIKSLAGGVAGTSQWSDTRIESGFLVDNLFRTVLTAVNEPPMLPVTYELYQNFPNPFNPTTIIAYTLPEQSHILLTIYDMLGRKVVQLVDETQEAGAKSLRWNGQNASGKTMASGMYFYRLETKGFVATKRMLLIK